MPVIIPKSLPATKILQEESIFVMNELRAKTQDIRPLKIAILNLMPKKIVTETQLLRLLSNTPLQIDVDLITPKTHESKNTSRDHLLKFYVHFDDIKDKYFDGMIMTGAPVEHLAFEEVGYWEELTRIMDFCKTNVYSTMFICWGAQAALYHYYGIPKIQLEKKRFGVFEHKILQKAAIVRGFNDTFLIPHSRYAETLRSDIEQHRELSVIARSDESGVYLTIDRSKRFVFVSGHAEYERYSLHEEYVRDREKGIHIDIPEHYYPDNDPEKEPVMNWGAHAYLLFSNWLNYHVYQDSPYDLSKIDQYI